MERRRIKCMSAGNSIELIRLISPGNSGNQKLIGKLAADLFTLRSSISIVTWLGVGRPESGFRQRQGFFSSLPRPHWILGPPSQWVSGASSPGVKRTGHKADHSLSSSAEVKMRGAIPPLQQTSSWRAIN
jgi:hypothetical protein